MSAQFEKYFITPEKVDTLLKESNLEFLSFKSLIHENSIYKIALTIPNTKIERHFIKDWDLFENNEKDLTENDFFNFFLISIPEDEKVILFTQEGTILKGRAFIFEVSDFFSFSSMYEDYFSMEFFQLSFYCILSRKMRICKFLDDTGTVNEIKFFSVAEK